MRKRRKITISRGKILKQKSRDTNSSNKITIKALRQALHSIKNGIRKLILGDSRSIQTRKVTRDGKNTTLSIRITENSNTKKDKTSTEEAKNLENPSQTKT